jgi:ubiquitin C-terminal hydrolase
MTLLATIQTLFHHMSTSLPHHPAVPKNPPPPQPNGATVPPAGAAALNNPSTTVVQLGPNGQPLGPSLLASLPPPSCVRGGGPYHAGTLGRGVVRPEDVLRTARRHNNMFGGQQQQDAHEFLGFVLNQLAEEVERLDADLKERGQEITNFKERGMTFIHSLFHGVLVNETRCLNCETTSSREESFLDLSIDIEQHSSLTACLRQFSHSEMLCSTNKFYCETCCGLVEAERRMRIKSLPNILGLHLKRFRQDDMGRLHKLFYRVTFPLSLRVPCTTEDTDRAERLYELFAVVVHIGK